MNGCARPHVLVTGASSGIGRATALHLAAGGHDVDAGVRKPDVHSVQSVFVVAVVLGVVVK